MTRPCIILLAVALLALAGTARAEPTLDSEEHALWILINDYRQANGVQPLSLNDDLMAAAEWMSGDLATREDDKFSHTDSLGRRPWQRMADFGYVYRTGEILVSRVATGQAALDMWKRSPGHDAKMLNPNFKVVGLARAFNEGSAYGWYWTVDFGWGPTWFPPTPTPSPVPTATPTPVPTPTLTLVSVPVELPSTGADPANRPDRPNPPDPNP